MPSDAVTGAVTGADDALAAGEGEVVGAGVVLPGSIAGAAVDRSRAGAAFDPAGVSLGTGGADFKAAAVVLTGAAGVEPAAAADPTDGGGAPRGDAWLTAGCGGRDSCVELSCTTGAGGATVLAHPVINAANRLNDSVRIMWIPRRLSDVVCGARSLMIEG